MKINKENIIFDLTRLDYKYKGVLFAEADNAEVDKQMQTPFPTPKNYLAGIMAIIWTDENEVWHTKLRFKFPSGNKQVISHSFDKEFEEGIKVNETYALQYLYKFPMVNKTWLPNPDGTGMGIIDLIKKVDMIESIQIEEKD